MSRVARRLDRYVDEHGIPEEGLAGRVRPLDRREGGRANARFEKIERDALESEQEP